MFTLNRVCVIGRLPQNPQIYSIDNNERVATLTMHTLLDKPTQQGPCKYNVFIESPNIVEYVNTFVDAGDMIYVEGRLEPVASKSKDHPDYALKNCISISKDQGLLLLVHSSSQILQKKDPQVDLN